MDSSKVWQRAAADLNPPGVPNSFRHAKNQQNIATVLLRREFGGSRRQKTVRAVGEDREENFWAESESAFKHQSRYFELPQTTKSTISIAISPDGFWDIETGRCLYVSTLRHAIISISFHPSGDILAVASGTCVYTWDYQHTCPRIAMFSYQTLRSVTFLPDPTKIMVGEANERYVRPQGQAPPSDLTVTLTMWDFDQSWALSPEPLLTKKAMNNSRVILSHALIYNDGGFDISRCGRYLAICADFSLRQAEKEVEMEAENEATTDLETILSSVPTTQDTTSGTVSPSDDVNDVSVTNPQVTASNESSSSSEAVSRTTQAAPHALPTTIPWSLPIHPPPPRLVPISGMHTGAPNMLAALQSAAADLSLTMDQYMNQQIRRVRPRLHPPHSIQRYTAAFEPARNTAAPVAVPQQRYSQIRPNIALSRTRFTRNQRNRRGRLSSENQSTWLALISLDPEQLGRVIQTCHLAETAAGGVTSVKISPTSAETEFPIHRVTRIYRWEDMALLSHVESAMDDVNIALFSPICGGGFLYGTKQGKLRVCNTFRGDFHDEKNCNVLDGPRRCHYDQNVNGDDADDDEDEDLGEDDEDDDDISTISDEDGADGEESDMIGDDEDEEGVGRENENEDAHMGE
ncbi:hypothetical protein PsorP6_002563 [Peronosclerospora sorghi]|uniref:Uncharacterized protein n=1 Tax=Peronosclerospora sorghi TaxID=230839 RepID=A0ACC0WXB8_9STRA|nr:hypothetical protein PsorP6_002563 [Peronosclerospora sorghi]